MFLYFQGLNNIVAIDFDYREEFIYWIDTSRPNGSRINRMCLNGSDIKVNLYLKYVTNFISLAWSMIYNLALDTYNDTTRVY